MRPREHPLLHEIAARRGLRLLSLETDADWMERFRQSMESPSHEFRLVTDWHAELERSEWSERWGLVFLDQQPWRRAPWRLRRCARSPTT